MAQTYSSLATGTFASNLAVDVGATETTVLDAIPSFGFENIGVEITCNSGSMTSCALYGSMDGVNYVAISSFTSFTLTTGQTKYAAATGIFQVLRLTCTGVSNIDAHLNAIIG